MSQITGKKLKERDLRLEIKKLKKVVSLQFTV
jgi:hypothetical protein